MARGKELNTRMKEEKRELILKTALKHFTAKGLSATKIKDIADGAGIAQGLMYNYYKSKEEIYAELISSAFDKMNEAAEALEALDIPADEKIRTAIVRLLKTIEESDDFNQTSRFISQAINTSAIPDEAKQTIAMKRDKPYQIISSVIREGQGDGTVIEGNPDELAVLFWTTISGFAIYKASREDNPPIPKADLIVNIFIKTKKEM